MLDTDIVSYTLKNTPARVRKAFDRHAGEM